MRAFDRRDDIHSAENGPPAMTSGFQKVASIRPAFHARAFFSGLPGVASGYSVLLRGRLHRCTMETCSARIDPHTVFALAPVAISLKNALKGGLYIPKRP